MQPAFRKTFALQLLAIILAVLAFERWVDGLADRTELGRRIAVFEATPVRLPPAAGQLRLAGAWQLRSADPRFGGISALALGNGHFLALTDSGAVVRFGKPVSSRIAGSISDLPDGPGNRRFKSSRDAESIVLDPDGRGWWVGFENRHSLWLFDSQFRQALERRPLGRNRWHGNGGLEGLVTDDGLVLGFPERGDHIVRFDGGGSLESVPIRAGRGRIADATRLPDGRIAVLNRDPGLTGFRNAVAVLIKSDDHYRYGESMRLPVSPIDNVEGIAAEPLGNGVTRLWMVTDNNYHAPQRTLLFAYDLPPRRKAH